VCGDGSGRLPGPRRPWRDHLGPMGRNGALRRRSRADPEKSSLRDKDQPGARRSSGAWWSRNCGSVGEPQETGASQQEAGGFNHYLVLGALTAGLITLDRNLEVPAPIKGLVPKARPFSCIRSLSSAVSSMDRCLDRRGEEKCPQGRLFQRHPPSQARDRNRVALQPGSCSGGPGQLGEGSRG